MLRSFDDPDYPLDLVKGLQGFRGIRNGSSVSGGWFLKALEHEYIDSRVFAEAPFSEDPSGESTQRQCCVAGGLHRK